ncbi:MAG: hypothetical protein ACI875_001258 [Planctomycetota bacterium]
MPKQNSVQSQGNSTNALARPCNIKRQQRSSQSVLRRPVEIAAETGHSLQVAPRAASGDEIAVLIYGKG